MSSDMVRLTASTTVNGEKISVALPVSGRLWTQMSEDYLLTIRTRLANEVIKHLDVTCEAVREGGNA
jgi:hypothetical protein